MPLAAEIDVVPVSTLEFGVAPSPAVFAPCARPVVALADDWARLAWAEQSPMESLGWSLAAAGSMEFESTPNFVTLGEADELRAIAPLADVKRNRIGRTEQLGLRRLNEPADWLAADFSARRELAIQILRRGRPLTIHRIFADSPTVEMMRTLGSRFGWTIIRPQAPCPQILLDETWREPESHLSSRRRSDFRRAWRRAEKLGPVETEIIAPTTDEVDGLLDVAFEIEAKSWKGATGTALAHDPVRASFMRQYARWAAQAGPLRLFFLSVGSKRVAMQIAAEQSGGLWLLKIGMDSGFSGCSPGILLLAESIRYAAEKQLATFEFLGVAEAWTRVWTERERPCVSVRHYPYNWRGAAALTADGLAATRSRWLARRSQAAGDNMQAAPSAPADESESS